MLVIDITGLIRVQPRLDRSVLVVKVGHVRHQVTNDKHMWQRMNGNHIVALLHRTQTRQRVATIDIHSTRAANAFTTRADPQNQHHNAPSGPLASNSHPHNSNAPTKRQRRVLLALDLNKSVQHHRTASTNVHITSQLQPALSLSLSQPHHVLVQIHGIRALIRLLFRLGVPAVNLQVLDVLCPSHTVRQSVAPPKQT